MPGIDSESAVAVRPQLADDLPVVAEARAIASEQDPSRQTSLMRWRDTADERYRRGIEPLGHDQGATTRTCVVLES